MRFSSKSIFIAVALSLVFTTNASSKKMNKKLIFIDPGHTLDFPGALGSCGTPEVLVNDALSLKISQLLTKKNYRVQFTRKPNTDIKKISKNSGREPSEELLSRGIKANEAHADLFISIHHDSVPETALVASTKGCTNSKISNPLVISDVFLNQPGINVGFNIFFTNDIENLTKNKKSLLLGKHIGSEFLKLNLKPATYHILPHEPDCQSCKFEDKNLGVMSRTLGALKNNKMPSVLIEVTNLKIKSMEQDALDPKYQHKISQAIVNAVLKYHADNE